ncbi:MAG TPA: ATP-binding protein [Stellaceae bacterium]|jgi:two-component system phosphate regulon sensor histidine kinase PhoR
MSGLPRLLLGSAFLASPFLLVLFVLEQLGEIDATPAWIAAILGYAGVVLTFRPLFGGLLAIQAAIRSMSENEAATPQVETLSPLARELWLALARWARGMRATLVQRASELSSLRAVETALPEPLLLLDSGRRIVSANDAAVQLLGDRLVDRDLAGALRHPAVLAATDAVLRGEGLRTVEFEIASPIERHLSARLAPLSPPTAQGAAAVLMLHDLTDLKRSERLRADFVANASHELRTPLASLVGFIETLRGPAREDTAARERFLAIMAEQAGRMSRLVDDLLSLSRIEMNEHRAPTGAVDLANVLHAVADTLEQRAAARQMEFAFKLPPDLAPVLGDADELTQVFQNLFDNAIKYGAAGTAIEVSGFISGRLLPAGRAGQRNAAVAVAIRDHGPGISRDFLPRLTERFYRVDPARSRELGGTGLGLAIVKHIVSHHRGALDIDSELGQGSVFTVHLPVAIAQP